MRPRRIGGSVADWLPACDAAMAADNQGAREFFEANFTPLAISVGGEREGQFTGYYEPVYEGSLESSPEYPVPLYSRPPDLVTADLGLFRADLDGRRIAGRIARNGDGGQLRPFESRAEIEGGALSGQGLELLWLKDPVDAFFLHIQGSGRVRLADGSLVKVGYAGPNGHPNTMIGRILVERGEVALEDMSMQAIREWIDTHPAEGAELMRKNASFIFFRRLQGDNPVGSLGTELTPRRSLAVDRSHLPLGAPYWVETSRPQQAAGLVVFNRLMIGEDTGGAIRGAVRGDIFWGRGEEAEFIAGHMANPGRMYILLPNALANDLANALANDLAKVLTANK